MGQGSVAVFSKTEETIQEGKLSGHFTKRGNRVSQAVLQRKNNSGKGLQMRLQMECSNKQQGSLSRQWNDPEKEENRRSNVRGKEAEGSLKMLDFIGHQEDFSFYSYTVNPRPITGWQANGNHILGQVSFSTQQVFMCRTELCFVCT